MSQEISKIRKYLENENGNTTYQNSQDVMKVRIRQKFVAVNTYIKQEERTQINNLTLHFKELGKEEQTKLKRR